MKKYILYKILNGKYSYLCSQDDYKTERDVLGGTYFKYKIICSNCEHEDEGSSLAKGSYMLMFNPEFMEFNSDEEAILWFRLTYGDNS